MELIAALVHDHDDSINPPHVALLVELATTPLTPEDATQTFSLFLVKTTELSAPGTLTLNGLCSAYLLNGLEVAPTGLKVFITVATIAIFAVNTLAGAIAKADEKNQSYLGVTSGFVIWSYVWLVILSGLMTYCLTGAAVWKILLVAIPVILVILAAWGMAFDHPKTLRRIVSCFAKDRAAANDANETEEGQSG